jgi:hypothetical protein
MQFDVAVLLNIPSNVSSFQRKRSLPILACGLSLIYLLIFPFRPNVFLATKTGLAAPRLQFPDITFLALNTPRDLIRFFCLAQSGNVEALNSLKRILSLVDVKFLPMSPRTVMNKATIAPSGSKHDFVRIYSRFQFKLTR